MVESGWQIKKKKRVTSSKPFFEKMQNLEIRRKSWIFWPLHTILGHFPNMSTMGLSDSLGFVTGFDQQLIRPRNSQSYSVRGQFVENWWGMLIFLFFFLEKEEISPNVLLPWRILTSLVPNLSFLFQPSLARGLYKSWFLIFHQISPVILLASSVKS